MKKLIYALIILIIFSIEKNLNAQDATCDLGLKAMESLRDLPDGDHEICSSLNGSIRFMAKVTKGEIVSWKSFDKSGNEIQPIRKSPSNSNAKAKSKGKSQSSSSPKQTPMKSVCEIWVYKMKDGKTYQTEVCYKVPK
ncbi:MAG: hypothetical protein JNK69_11920 [Saprospiraceae bacterium]|nr:hypothetical protein [Saprospiraceae bacterium]HRG34037.1 hypothetical protein [Saprospiraceae bacterium]